MNQTYRRLKLFGLATAVFISQTVTFGSTVTLAQSTPTEKVPAGKPARKTLQLATQQPARIVPIERALIHSKIPAYVEKVLVDLGDRVAAGQILAVLSAPEMQIDVIRQEALVQQAIAEQRQSESALSGIRAQVVAARAAAKQVDAGMGKARADEVRWRAELARFERLASDGVLNQQVVDETRQKAVSAEAAVQENAAAGEAAAASILLAESQLEKGLADVNAAKSHKQVAAAAQQYAEVMLRYRELRSPFAGVITRRSVDSGQFVNAPVAGAEALLSVARTDIVRAYVLVPENEAPLVEIGAKVTLQITSLRNQEVSGHVSRTSWELHDANRSLEVAIDLANPEGKLRPGMYGTARIVLSDRVDVLVLPTAAVTTKDKDTFCFRLIEGKAVQTKIQLGIKVGTEWEICEGVTDADLIAISKASSLQDGQNVEPLTP